MRDAFVRVLLEEMRKNDRIVLLTGDLGFGVLRPVKEAFPDRLINAGIAEQGMVSLAAGLSATRRTVIVYSIGNFPTLRPLEQIRNDCAYHEANVKLVCVGGGFIYGSLGMSHHATEDLSVMRALPQVVCFAPGDPAETEAVTREMLRQKGVCYLRLGRGNEPRVHAGAVENWEFPRAICLREGADAAILSTGGILTQAMGASELLEKQGIAARVMSFPCIKPLDRPALEEVLRRYRRVVTVEENTVVGGFGSAVCETAAETGFAGRVLRVGLNDCFATVVGEQQYLRKVYGMDAESIAARTMAFLKE